MSERLNYRQTPFHKHIVPWLRPRPPFFADQRAAIWSTGIWYGLSHLVQWTPKKALQCTKAKTQE